MPVSDRNGNLHGRDGRFVDKPVGRDDDLDVTMPPLLDDARTRCVECAKRREIDLIWRTASIEVRGITFPDTATIYAGVSPDDAGEVRKVLTVNNIKHAWQYLLDHVQDPVDWQYLSDYNRLCGQYLEINPGMMRNRPVTIGGTSWTPKVMVHDDDVFRGLERVHAEPDPVRKALRLFSEVCRGQWFHNGNKRTATMGANHVMIHEGVGVFALPPQRMDGEFADRLLEYYETGDVDRFMDWLDYHAVGRLEDQGLTRAQLDGVDPGPGEDDVH